MDGAVTLLMTDVEGSTRMWEEHPDLAGSAIERHEALIGEAVAARNGALIKSKGEGDSTFSVFDEAVDALVAAVELQRAMRREPWPEGCEVRLRAALYTGPAELRGGDYQGVGPNRGGRLRSAAHGGQIVCSQPTEELIATTAGPGLPADVSLRDLGLHRLRDLASAERVFQVDHPDLPDDFPPLRSLGVRHNLPAPRTSFLGRHSDQVAVHKHLDAGRLVTLTGVGGCGKTRLAVEVATAQLERFPDGVFFVDLAPVTDAAALPATVAAAVGFARLAIGTGSGQPSAELLDYLSAREVLLVIDNCEHLVEACSALVDEILERCASVSVLATSREVLHVQGEQSYPVPPLGLADGSGEGSEAAELFAARACLVDPRFEVAPADVAAVEEICRRLDGIPLAIELAAAQIAHLSPRQINERLDDRFRLLTGGSHRTGRQQTLHAALDWSHDLLEDGERRALRRMAVFPGTFTSASAGAVCDEPMASEVMRSLVHKSMVVTDDNDGVERRFRLLETVRAYAQEQLVAAGEDQQVRDRHRDHFLAWAESIPAERTYLDPDGWIRRERDNLQSALAWSEERGRADLVGRIASTMMRVWVGDVTEGRRWLAAGVAAGDDLDPEHRTRVLAVAAQVAVLANEAFDGELARLAVAASDGRPGMWSSLAHSLLCLNTGVRGFFTKDPFLAAEAERLGRLAVDLATDPLSTGLAWFYLGQARVLLDDLDGAIDALELATPEAIPGGDMSAVSLAMQAGLLHVRGRHDEALAAATEVFERERRFEHSGLWAWVLYCSLPYALELGHRGRHEEALAFVRDLLEDGDPPTAPGAMTSVVIVLAALAALRGDLRTADLLLERAGDAIITSGMRTPVDLAVYTHYFSKVSAVLDADASRINRGRAAGMDLGAAIAFGLAGRVEGERLR